MIEEWLYQEVHGVSTKENIPMAVQNGSIPFCASGFLLI
jgi:hypothetical protein